MDIQIASNFERYLYYRVGEDPAKVRELLTVFARTGRMELAGGDPDFAAGSAQHQETLDTIRRYWDEWRFIPDPHTAVGLAVAERFLREDMPTICLATAHPAKFPAAVVEAIGDSNAARHERVEALFGRPTRCAVRPATKDAIEGFIVGTLAEGTGAS